MPDFITVPRMNEDQLVQINDEIDDAFISFYAKNVNKFRSKYGVAQFNGVSLNYDSMLPIHVKIGVTIQENEKVS